MIDFRRVFLVLFKWACRCSKQFVSSKLFCSQKKRSTLKTNHDWSSATPRDGPSKFPDILFHAEAKMIAYLMIWRSVVQNSSHSSPTTCQKVLLNKYGRECIDSVPLYGPSPKFSLQVDAKSRGSIKSWFFRKFMTRSSCHSPNLELRGPLYCLLLQR